MNSFIAPSNNYWTEITRLEIFFWQSKRSITTNQGVFFYYLINNQKHTQHDCEVLQ